MTTPDQQFTRCGGTGHELEECTWPSFQQRVQPWLLACFGADIAADRIERNHRFLEEALELVQSTGCTSSEAHQLVDYVFRRIVGEPAQEVGGVMVTLAALCLANGLDMHDAGEVELARIWTKVEAIRAKQAAKPKHSPLPAAPVALAPVACGSWDHLKLMMEHSAWDGALQLADALANIDDFSAAPTQAAPVAQLSEPLKWLPIETAPQSGLVDIFCNDRRYADCHFDKICGEFRHITACGRLIRLKGASHWMVAAAAPTTPKEGS